MGAEILLLCAKSFAHAHLDQARALLLLLSRTHKPGARNFLKHGNSLARVPFQKCDHLLASKTEPCHRVLKAQDVENVGKGDLMVGTKDLESVVQLKRSNDQGMLEMQLPRLTLPSGRPALPTAAPLVNTKSQPMVLHSSYIEAIGNRKYG